MDIRKDKFLASLMVFGLATGAAACGDSAEAEEQEAAPMTTGGDTMAEPDPMMEPEPMDTGMDEPADDFGGGDDMGAEEDLGPTPE